MTNNQSEARAEKRAAETIIKRAAKKSAKVDPKDTVILFAAIYEKQVQQEDGSYETEDETVEFRIPKKFSPSTGLRLMKTLRLYGEEAMIAELLEKLLGPEKYEAFLDLELEEDEMSPIVKKAMEIVFGPLEDSSKN